MRVRSFARLVEKRNASYVEWHRLLNGRRRGSPEHVAPLRYLVAL